MRPVNNTLMILLIL